MGFGGGRRLAKVEVDLSENSFLGALVIIASAVGSVVGVAALFVQDPKTLISIAAGAAWSLSLCLFVINGMQRRNIAHLETQISELKTEVSAAKSQADHWSSTASNVSQATLVVLQMVPPAPNPPPRRAPAAVHAIEEIVPGEAR